MHEFLSLNATFGCALPKPARRAKGFRYVDSGPELDAVKHELQAKGWNYRAASAFLGVHATHFKYVITGRRKSARLLEAIRALPHFQAAAAKDAA